MLQAFEEPFLIEGHELFVTASIGISLYPRHGSDVETLVKNADTAMYRAKEQGRNNYQFYVEAFSTSTVEQIAFETSLRRALERDEFVTYYQPRLDLETREMIGAEALVRWKHPELGLLLPTQFISLAEDIGLISQIGEWVLRSACRQNKAWQDAGFPPISVSVNISPRQLQHQGLAMAVDEALKETGLYPGLLELELTESALMHNPEFAAEVLHDLKQMGVRISIDDFGIGYSSLSRIKRLPIDGVKIDRSFVRDITTNSDDAAIAAAIIAMARSLKLTVTAEGVETLDQLELLQSMNCDEVQGYFLSRPVPASELTDLLVRSIRLSHGRLCLAA